MAVVPGLADGADPELLPPLISWVLGRAGVGAAAYGSVAMRRRVPACLRQLRVSSEAAARELIERRPELLSCVLNTVLIGVSGFFRDHGVFDCVEKTVLPALAATANELRVCAAGVSGGQELYSVAMLLAEAGLLARANLVGIDCRVDAIRSARGGVFQSDALTGVDSGRRERFFDMVEGRWHVRDVIKKQIRWRVQDLQNTAAGEAWDLILFRNVAIYFNETHRVKAWGLLCDQLAPGGFLITGKAEKPPGSLPFNRVAPSIFQKNLF